MSPTIAKFGSWKSPITSATLSASSISIPELFADPVTNILYHVENRPYEEGRGALIRNFTELLTPAPLNVRTGVHEYGGNPAAARGGIIVFSEFESGVLYWITMDDSTPKPLTPESLEERFADITIHPSLSSLVCIHEVHGDKQDEIVNQLCSVTLNRTGEESKPCVVMPQLRLNQPHRDFYSTPRFSPSGKYISWLEWDHPDMPWTSTELYIGEWINEEVLIKNRIKVAGGKDSRQSITRPRWSPSGDALYYVSDVLGFYNIYKYEIATKQSISIYTINAEFGSPDWAFGISTYAILSDNSILAYYTELGISKLGLIKEGSLEVLTTRYIDIDGMSIIKLDGKEIVYFLAGGKRDGEALIKFDLESRTGEIIKKVSEVEIADKYLSEAKSVEFPTANNLTSYCYFYMPKNDDYRALEGEKPPAILRIHGGPTSHCVDALQPRIQYLTSRGFAFLDINYGGSSNYGRDFRERLNGNWGVVDVEDASRAALYFAEKGFVDEKRIAITGASAGGYTALCCLCFRPKIFTAGVSSYGVSDLVSLFQFTHKFESHYLEGLLGGTPTSAPQVYHDRSPINFANQIIAPLLVLQGNLDKIVPPEQSEAICNAITKNGGKCKYVLLEGEGHGFRQGKNIKKALDSELDWFRTVFQTGGFEEE